jgi:hypothetical protein
MYHYLTPLILSLAFGLLEPFERLDFAQVHCATNARVISRSSPPPLQDSSSSATDVRLSVGRYDEWLASVRAVMAIERGLQVDQLIRSPSVTVRRARKLDLLAE